MDRLLDAMLDVKLHFSYWKDNAAFPNRYDQSGIVEGNVSAVQDNDTGTVLELPDTTSIENKLSDVNGFDIDSSNDIIGQLTPKDSNGKTSAKVLVTATVNPNTLMYQSLKDANSVIQSMMPSSMEGSWEYIKTDETRLNSKLSSGRNEWVISVFPKKLKSIDLDIYEEGNLEQRIRDKTPPVSGSISPDISTKDISGITVFTRTNELHKDSMEAIVEAVEEIANEKSVEIEEYALSIS